MLSCRITFIARPLARDRGHDRLCSGRRGVARGHDRRWAKFSARRVRYIFGLLPSPSAEPSRRLPLPPRAVPVAPARHLASCLSPRRLALRRTGDRTPVTSVAEVDRARTPISHAPNPQKRNHPLPSATAGCWPPRPARATTSVSTALAPLRPEARSGLPGLSSSGDRRRRDRPPSARGRPTSRLPPPPRPSSRAGSPATSGGGRFHRRGEDIFTGARSRPGAAPGLP